MRLFNILLLASLVSVVGCESREQARRKQVVNNMKQIRLALDAYHAKHAEAVADTSAEAAPDAAVDERRAEKTARVSGEVVEFHRSPDGEVDGIALKDGTEVRFPPGFGEKVTDIVSIGDQVEFVGWTHTGEPEVHAATVTNVANGKSVEVDRPPPDSPD